MSARPLVPPGRALRLGLTAAVASRGLVAASVVWLVVLAAVYATDAGPPLQAMAVTAAALLPVGAWIAAASLAATGDDVRALLTAADGRLRVLAVDVLGPVLLVLAAAVLGVLAPLVADPHPAPLRSWLVGAALHVLVGAVGVGLGALLHALRLARGTQAVVVLLATLLSARLRWLPPVGPVLSSWGAGRPPSAGPAAWALVGPVVLAALLLGLAGAVRRRGR